jgi:hypothetical protein
MGAGVRLCLVLAVLLVPVAPAMAARTGDADLCARAIARSEAAGTLPQGLLTAIAAAESGRYDQARRAVAPWPWTVNNAGDGRYFATKAEAIAHVSRLRAAGERNIDVGCMQINLMHHPDAFRTLEEAFEPSANVAYGARFLGALERETSSWARAVERYHTADPARGRAYRERVYQRWAAAPDDGGPAGDHPHGGEIALAGVAPAEPPAAPAAERRRLKPLSGRGFVSFGDAGTRVAVLRPSADRQLRPIVRPPRRSSVGLVRLASSRRAVAMASP